MRADRESLTDIHRVSGAINTLSGESVHDWKTNDFAAHYLAGD